MPIQQYLYSIPEVAKSLSLSRSTIYRLISTGELETLSVRGVLRIRPEAIERFLKQQERNHREALVK